MYKIDRARVLTRATLAVGAVLVVITGVTFAALQSQKAVLRGSTIQTASANLQISNDNTNFTSSVTGFTYGSIIPGGQPSPTIGNPVFLKNTGSTSLAIAMSIDKAVINQNNVDLSKVYVVMTPVGGGAGQRISLQDLANASPAGGVPVTHLSRLISNQTAGVNLQIQMDADAFSGPSATLSDIDISFGGTSVN